MNNFTKVRLISKATLRTIKDNPRIILQAIFFFTLMLVPIIALWGWIISQYSSADIDAFFAGNWNGSFSIITIIALIISIIWGAIVSTYFEFVITKILLQYWNYQVKGGISFSKVLAYTGFSFGIGTIGSILPGLFSGIYGIVVPAITSLIPSAILDNPNKSIKQTLQENKDIFGKVGGYAAISQLYQDFFIVFGLVLVIFCALFIGGFSIYAGLNLNVIIESGVTSWATKLWDVYLLFAIISFIMSIIIILFYRVLSYIIISTSLYVWYKNGNNPAEFQKVFLERALSAKKSEVFFK